MRLSSDTWPSVVWLLLFGAIGGGFGLTAVGLGWWADPVGLWSTLLTLGGVLVGALVYSYGRNQ